MRYFWISGAAVRVTTPPFIYSENEKGTHVLPHSVISVGNDTRKLIADGYPLEQVVTSDLRQGICPYFSRGVIDVGKDFHLLTLFCFCYFAEFADLGHRVFRTTPETYPIAFVPGDVFDPKHLEVVPPVAYAHASASDHPSVSAPTLHGLTSLNPLHGRVFAIHASSFFHLFSEEKQLHVARALAGLLSPEPGSVIFGMQVGLPEKGFDPSVMMWCHSPESWTQLWDDIVFEKGVVNVQTTLVQMGKKYLEPDAPQNTTYTVLVWSVMRL